MVSVNSGASAPRVSAESDNEYDVSDVVVSGTLKGSSDCNKFVGTISSSTCSDVEVASTEQVSLLYTSENSYGCISSAEADIRYKKLGITSESLTVDRAYATSEELTGDRQTADLIPSDLNVSGDISGELSFYRYDELLSAALCSNWGNEIKLTEVSCNIKKLSKPKTCYYLEIPKSSFPTLKDSIVVGMSLYLDGFTESKNNGIHSIKEVKEAGGNLHLVLYSSLIFTSDPQTISIKGCGITNGSEKKSYRILKRFNDVDKEIQYNGMCVNGFSLNVEVPSVTTINFSFIGKDSSFKNQRRDLTDKVDSGIQSDVMSSSTQKNNLLFGGRPYSLLKNTSFELSNNLEGLDSLGQLGSVGIMQGKFTVTGSLVSYFTDFSMYSHYAENLSSSLSFSLTDGKAGVYVFHFPNIKLNKGTIVAGGVNQPVLVDSGFNALKDRKNTCSTLIISKIALKSSENTRC